MPPIAAPKVAAPPKPAAAPSLAGTGSAADFSALLGKAAPAGGSSLGLSRLGQAPAGSKAAGTFGQPPAGQPKPAAGMSWLRQQPQAPPSGKQPVGRQTAAAPALQQRLQAGQVQGTPGSALPKHMQVAAAAPKVGGWGQVNLAS